MKRLLYLGLSILELSKIVICEYLYDYVRLKYGEKIKLCYMDTDGFIVDIKADAIFKNIAKDLEIRFDTSSYEFDRPFPEGKNKKVIGLIKDELGFIGLRTKIYSYLKEDGSDDKKAKCAKKCAIKGKLKFEDYKNCLETT